MKIGLDARMYRSGVAGIGRYSQNLIKNLLEIDKKNQYVLFMTSADAKEIKMQISNIKNKNQKFKIIITDIPHFSLAEQFRLPKIIEKENLDLMHFLNFNYPVRYKAGFVVTIHDLTLLFYPETARDSNVYKKFGFRYVMKKACQNSAKIIAVSENTKKDIMQKMDIEADKIQVIYEAADDMTFNRHPEFVEGSPANAGLKQVERSFAGAQDDKPIILCAGQFRPHKNIAGLLRAFEILRSQMPCQLALLGGAQLNDEMKVLLDKSAYREDIKMPGFVSDKELISWYKIASVFVFPSFYEGFGLPGLEAMMAGTPVVASNRSSLPEIYQDAALYFDPFDAADIAAKIKEVLENKNLQKQLIEKGHKVAGKYSWRKTAEQTLKIYEEMKEQL